MAISEPSRYSHDSEDKEEVGGRVGAGGADTEGEEVEDEKCEESESESDKENIRPSTPSSFTSSPPLNRAPAPAPPALAPPVITPNEPRMRFIIQDRPSVISLGKKVWQSKFPELVDSGVVEFQGTHDPWVIPFCTGTNGF